MASSQIAPPHAGCSEFLGRHGIFFAQVTFSMIGLLFACVMLWKGEPAGQYLPVLTGIIGYWVPNPKSGKTETTTTTDGANTTVTAGGGLLPTFIRRTSHLFSGKQRPDSTTPGPPAASPPTGAPGALATTSATAALPTHPHAPSVMPAPPPVPAPHIPDMTYSRHGNGAPTTLRSNNPELPLPPGR